MGIACVSRCPAVSASLAALAAGGDTDTRWAEGGGEGATAAGVGTVVVVVGMVAAAGSDLPEEDLAAVSEEVCRKDLKAVSGFFLSNLSIFVRLKYIYIFLGVHDVDYGGNQSIKKHWFLFV